MKRTWKLMSLAALSAWLMASTGCEDKVCKQDLAMSKKEASDLRKESAASQTTIQELKTLLAETQAKAESLTKENAELKKGGSAEGATAGKANAKSKAKGKATKGKHKKKGKR
jgi:hypothetical protein